MPDTPTRRHGGGPKTEEGKKRSSLNALKHGLTARSPQAYERMVEDIGYTYDQIVEEMYRHFCPADPMESQLVKRIARCVWRLTVSEAMEKRVTAHGSNPNRPNHSCERILKYERLVDIHLHRAISALERSRARRPQIIRRDSPPWQPSPPTERAPSG